VAVEAAVVAAAAGELAVVAAAHVPRQAVRR
jgi:hypothetical protein